MTKLIVFIFNRKFSHNVCVDCFMPSFTTFYILQILHITNEYQCIYYYSIQYLLDFKNREHWTLFNVGFSNSLYKWKQQKSNQNYQTHFYSIDSFHFLSIHCHMILIYFQVFFVVAFLFWIFWMVQLNIILQTKKQIHKRSTLNALNT